MTIKQMTYVLIILGAISTAILLESRWAEKAAEKDATKTAPKVNV